MKKLFISLLCLVAVFSITACGNDKKNTTNNNNDTNTNETNNSLSSINDFETEFQKLNIEYEKTEMAAAFVGAESGVKLTSSDYKLELYSFDKNSEAYKTAEETQQLSMEGFGNFDAIVKNGYAIMIDNDFPNYDDVMNIFDKLK